MKNVLINMLNVRSGGQWTYMVNLLSESASLSNYSFTILTNIIAENRLKSISFCIPNNVSIYTVTSKYSYGTTSYIWQVLNLPRIVQEIKPDYIYAPTHIAYKVPGVKTILAMRNMAIPNFLKIDVPFKMRLNLFSKYLPMIHSLRRADKIVAVSNYVKDYLKVNIGKKEKDIFVAYHMVNNLHKQDNSELESYDDIKKDNFFVFIPGSYYRYKKYHSLLKNLERVGLPANAKVIFAGDEADAGYLRQLMKYKSQTYKPTFKVSISEHEMKYLYKAARLVILSSQVEACPNVAIEALANKARILASNIPPIQEILGGFATYFNINNENDFVNTFKAAVSSTPDNVIQSQQMKKISNENSLRDLLVFFESD
jgi:hypothetical protein